MTRRRATAKQIQDLAAAWLDAREDAIAEEIGLAAADTREIDWDDRTREEAAVRAAVAAARSATEMDWSEPSLEWIADALAIDRLELNVAETRDMVIAHLAAREGL